MPKVLLAALSVVGVSAQPYAYVSGFGNTVAIVNVGTGVISSTIYLSGGTSGIAATPDGNYLYVAEQSANSVVVISLATNTVVATIATPTTPTQIGITPNGAQAYVLSRGSAQVYAVNTTTLVPTPISVASKPMQVAFSADGTRAYVALYGGSIAIIDTTSNTVINNIAAVYGMSSIAVANGHLYAANQTWGTISVYDTAGNLQTTISGLASPNWLAASPNGAVLYATNGNGIVSVINTSSNNLAMNITVGSLPTSVAFSADGVYAYVTNEYSYTLSQIAVATNTIVKTFSRVIVYPYSVATSPAPSGGNTCTYSLSAPSASFTASGGSGSVNVTAPSGCGWSVANTPAWVNLTGGSGTGNGTVSFTVGANNGSSQSATLTIAGLPFTISESGVNSHIRVRCGGPQITDGSGNVWVSDNAGNFSGTNAPIANTSTPALYQSEAWSTGTLTYTYNVTPGTYTVALKFAEYYLTTMGERTFNIVINNVPVMSNFDILATAGVMNKAVDETFTVTSTGQITIQLVPVIHSAKIDAIEIY